MSSASVEAAEDPVGSRMTIVARAVVVLGLPPGKSIACDISVVSSR